MAKLSEAQRRGVWKAVMEWWSQYRTPVPISKPQLFTLIGLFDDAFEDLDTAVISAILAGPIRDWLIAEQQIPRQIEVLVAKARRDNL